MSAMNCRNCGAIRSDDGWDAPGKLGEHYPPCAQCGDPAFVEVTTDDLRLLWDELHERHATQIHTTSLELAGVKAWADKQPKDPTPVPADPPGPWSLEARLFGLPIVVDGINPDGALARMVANGDVEAEYGQPPVG